MPTFGEAPRLEFSTDITAILEALDYMDKIPLRFLEEIATDIASVGKATLSELFEQALAKQDDYPEAMKQHVRNVVEAADLDKLVTRDFASVAFDFSVLGDTTDLKRAFHQGAQLKGGGVVDGPWDESMELKNDDASRHIFWESVRRGASGHTAGTRRGKGGRFQKGGQIPIKEGAWDETVQKYIEIWGEKAPEWIYLQYGQTRWEPQIKASSIIEDFDAIFTRRANEMWNDRLALEVSIAERTRSTAPGLGYTPSYYSVAPNTGRTYYNYRNKAGRFSKRG